MIAVFFAGLGIAIAVAGRGVLRGTTLLGPWIWLLVSLTALAGVELAAAAGADALGIRPLRFAAVTTTFCPIMALLGAKRPQDRGWHFVVLTLWIVLALPAAETWLVRPGQTLDIRGLRAGFLTLLILLALANSSVTRFWPAAVLFAAAQTVLLAEFLWEPTPGWLAVRAAPLGTGLIVAALASAFVRRTRGRSASPWDRLWLDFRDLFGLLWGLRLAERVNAAAERYDWPVRLRWKGFTATDGSPLTDQLSPETARALEQNLENLLRRFVSPTWIARYFEKQVDYEKPRAKEERA